MFQIVPRKAYLLFNYHQLLKDRLAELRLLEGQPLPGSCQSLSATSSILLTLGWGPERAISQTSGYRDAASSSGGDFGFSADCVHYNLSLAFMSEEFCKIV